MPNIQAKVDAEFSIPNIQSDLKQGYLGSITNLDKRGWNPMELTSKSDAEKVKENEVDVEREDRIIELMQNFPELLQMHIDWVNMGKRGFNPDGYTKYIQMLRRRIRSSHEDVKGERSRIPKRISYAKTSPFKTYFKFRTKYGHSSLNHGKRGFNRNSLVIV